MNNLGSAYVDAGKRELALPLLKETLRRRKEKFGPDHRSTLSSMEALALAHGPRKLDEALPLLEELLKRRKTKLGPEHPDSIKTMVILAGAYRHGEMPEKARPLY